jgi:hypothetical protein
VCTLVLLHRPGAAWPVLLGANRDEMLTRPWQTPAAHWPEQPGVAGGRDSLAGGTWLAMNEHGVVAGVLNRTGTLGPQDGKRSRGELPLMALRYETALDAATDAADWDGEGWRSFNLVVADPTHAFFIRGLGEGPILVQPMPPGLSMTTAGDPNDLADPRIARHLPAFQHATPPDPPVWGEWPALLSDSAGAWREALNVPPQNGFGTASSSLIAVKPGEAEFLFTDGQPGSAPFQAYQPASRYKHG